jgi:hypothetical protein
MLVCGNIELLTIRFVDVAKFTNVGTALGYELDDRGYESRQGLGIFLFTTASRLGLKPIQPPFQ